MGIRRAKVERFYADSGLELAEPGVVPVRRRLPDGAAPLPEQPDAAHLESLDDIRGGSVRIPESCL